jgi:hypothetical protein
LTSQDLTLANLQATLQLIDPARPHDSPLLRMAQSAHGPLRQAPLQPREVKQLDSLREWMSSLEQATPDPAAEGSALGEGSAAGPPTSALLRVPSAPAPVAASTGDSAGSAAAASTPVGDPFDPAAYNARYAPRPTP